ncbi:uncharacterized protein AB9W97_012367 [Spinachia spinachia]
MVCLNAVCLFELFISLTLSRPQLYKVRMAEVAPAAAAAAAPKAAKKKVSKPKKVGPSVSDLIVKTVAASKERSGVSAAAVKKALTAGGYDVDKNKARVKTAIKSLVAKGTLVQIKGIGASGSFKMSKTTADKPATKAAPKAKKPAAKKPVAAKKPKAAAVKKVVAAKKSPKKAKKPAAAKKVAKSPKKVAKKVTKSPRKVVKKAPAAKKTPVKKAAKPKAKKAAPKKKHGVFRQLAGQQQADGGLDLPGGDGGALVVVSQTRGLTGDALKDVAHKRVHDAHGLGGDAGVGVDLLHHLVHVDGVALLPGLPLLLAALADGLGDGFLGALPAMIDILLSNHKAVHLHRSP